MAKCYNCERLLCSHNTNTHDIANQYEGECGDYVPHYIDEEIPIESVDDGEWVNFAEELKNIFEEESEEDNEANN